MTPNNVGIRRQIYCNSKKSNYLFYCVIFSAFLRSGFTHIHTHCSFCPLWRIEFHQAFSIDVDATIDYIYTPSIGLWLNITYVYGTICVCIVFVCLCVFSIRKQRERISAKLTMYSSEIAFKTNYFIFFICKCVDKILLTFLNFSQFI